MQHTTAFSKTEDFWAIMVGCFLLLAGLGIYLAIIPDGLTEKTAALETTLGTEAAKPFKTIVWHEANAALDKQKLTTEPAGKFLKTLTDKPAKWRANPVEAFVNPKSLHTTTPSDEAVKAAKQLAEAAESAAVAANFADTTLNSQAVAAIAGWQKAQKDFEKEKAKTKPIGFDFLYLAGLFLLFLLLFGFGAMKMGGQFGAFAKGFGLVFLLAFVSMFLAGQKDLHDIGIEYAVWAIVLGMLISNTIGTPKWANEALKTEFFIKTGLIVMGAEILFNKMLAIGIPGLFVAWVVTPIVLVSTFWFGQNVLKIASKSLNITISADMSVCGVSAAVAVAAASKATKQELTVAIGLSMVFTAIMMVVMPMFVKFTGMPEILGGAWIGGTVDSSGAVVAAGAALGEKAMYVAATIKMIQNVLIGFVAFGVAIYFATKVEKQAGGPSIGAGEIWRRFPKFILAFLGASILFTGIYTLLGDRMAYSVVEEGVLNGFTKNLRTWLFCLAFASIGLSTNFRELRHHFSGGKPLLLYVCGQLFNILLTLLMALLMFYKVFPEITGRI